ncbi:hypothetical protein [Clostridium butyricum]|uniref:hypothetical protein n=1 Tax=Clostridium butyricum TaxID=1492 RepID=UPI0018A8AF12|nr:hypothetical protein [Clostridium butyricum]MCQ2013471.1 hypothetical protein [Clostridium butyricum]MCQ2025688.1 hypothetical protein [Clostridium butyricum]MDB2158816.1 hypothetical protein [Clostridium butyricum]
MNKKIVIFYTLLTLVIGGVIGFLITSKTQNTVSSTDTVQENLNDKKIVSGYSFEKTNKNIINKEFDGDYLDSFVTVAQIQDEFTVNLKGVDTDNVFIIDPVTGEMTNMNKENEVYTVNMKFNNDINYGIIVDYKLVGSIRVVNDLNDIDEDKLFRDILISLGCGL